MSGRFTRKYIEDFRLIKTVPQRATAGFLLLLALATPLILSIDFSPPLGFPWKAWFTAINVALIASVAAAAFNLLLGYTGQISIAHAAFLILGSIVGAVLGDASAGLGWSFFLVLPIAAVVGALIGVIVGIPALRVRGLYLFMATLAVHFAAIFAFKKYQVANVGFSGVRYNSPTIPSWLHWLPFINPDDNGEFLIRGNFRWYWIILPIAMLSILFMVNVLRTREGRAFVAVRDNDVAASLLGVNVAKTKLLAFATSSAMVTMAGVMLAFFVGARSDESWSIQIILDYSIMVVVGGFSTILGGVLGAFFFYLTPVGAEWLRGLEAFEGISFLTRYGAQIDLALFGMAIILVLVFKPDGLAGLWADVKRYFRLWPYRY